MLRRKSYAALISLNIIQRTCLSRDSSAVKTSSRARCLEGDPQRPPLRCSLPHCGLGPLKPTRVSLQQQRHTPAERSSSPRREGSTITTNKSSRSGRESFMSNPSAARHALIRDAYAAEQQLTSSITFDSVKHRVMRSTMAYSRIIRGLRRGGGKRVTEAAAPTGPSKGTELPPYLIEIRISMRDAVDGSSSSSTDTDEGLRVASIVAAHADAATEGGIVSVSALACRVVTNSPLVAYWLLDEFRSHATALIWEGQRLANTNNDKSKKKQSGVLAKSYMHIHVNAEGKFVNETLERGGGVGGDSRHIESTDKDGDYDLDKKVTTHKQPKWDANALDDLLKDEVTSPSGSSSLHYSPREKDATKLSRLLDPIDIPSVWNFLPNIAENLRLQHAAAAEQLHRRDLLVESKDGGFLALAKARFHTYHKSRADRKKRVDDELRKMYEMHKRHSEKGEGPAATSAFDEYKQKYASGGQKRGGGGGPAANSPALSRATVEEIEKYFATQQAARANAAGSAGGTRNHQKELTYAQFQRFTQTLASLQRDAEVFAANTTDEKGGGFAGYYTNVSYDHEPDVGTTVVPLSASVGRAINDRVQHYNTAMSGAVSFGLQSHGANSSVYATVQRRGMEEETDRIERQQYLMSRCGGLSVGLRGAVHAMLGGGAGEGGEEGASSASSTLLGSRPATGLGKIKDVDVYLTPHTSLLSRGAVHKKATPPLIESPSQLVNSVAPSMTFPMTRARSLSDADPTSSLLVGKAGRFFWASVPLADGGFVSSWTQPKGATGSPLYRDARESAAIFSRQMSATSSSSSSSPHTYYLGDKRKVAQEDAKSGFLETDDAKTSRRWGRDAIDVGEGEGEETFSTDGGSGSSATQSSLNFLHLPQNKQSPAIFFMNKKRNECVIIVDVDPSSNQEGAIPQSALIGGGGGGSGERITVTSVLMNNIPKADRRFASKTLSQGLDVNYIAALTVPPSSSASGQYPSSSGHRQRNGYGDEADEEEGFGSMVNKAEGLDIGGLPSSGRSYPSSSASAFLSTRWSPQSHDHFKALRQEILRQIETIFVASVVPATGAVWCGGAGVVFETKNLSTGDITKESKSNSEALVFVGPPGSGKTTMALHCFAASAAATTTASSQSTPTTNTDEEVTTKLLGCESFCVLPTAPIVNGGAAPPPRLGVLGFPLNPTLGFGTLVGSLLPNTMLDKVLLSTERVKQAATSTACVSTTKNDGGKGKNADIERPQRRGGGKLPPVRVEKSLFNEALLQESANRALARQILMTGGGGGGNSSANEEALWSWDRKIGAFSAPVVVEAGGSSVNAAAAVAEAERGRVTDEERFDCSVVERKASSIPTNRVVEAANNKDSTEAAALSFNPINIDSLASAAFGVRGEEDCSKHSSNSSVSSSSSPARWWQCFSGTLRYVIVLNWTHIPSSSSAGTPHLQNSNRTFIRKLTRTDEIKAVLGIDLIKAQLDRLTGADNDGGNPRAAASSLDTSDVDAEVHHLLTSSSTSSSSAGFSSEAATLTDETSQKLAKSIVPTSASVGALLASGGAATLAMPVNARQLLERVVTSAELQKQRELGSTSTSVDALAVANPSAEAHEERKVARLSVTLDSMTRFTAFNGITPSGALSSSSVGDGSRSVGLVKRHLFLDDAAVPPIVLEVGDNAPPSSSGFGVRGGRKSSLPQLVAATIAEYSNRSSRDDEGASLRAPSSDGENSDPTAPTATKDENSKSTTSIPRKCVAYDGIEVYEVTGAVNMELVRDFALSLGKRGLVGE